MFPKETGYSWAEEQITRKTPAFHVAKNLWHYKHIPKATRERIDEFCSRWKILIKWQFVKYLEPVREKVEFEEALVVLSPALLLRRRADVES